MLTRMALGPLTSQLGPIRRFGGGMLNKAAGSRARMFAQTSARNCLHSRCSCVAHSELPPTASYLPLTASYRAIKTLLMNHVPVALFQIRGSLHAHLARQFKHAPTDLATDIHVGSPLFALYCWRACGHLPAPLAYSSFADGHEGLLLPLLC